MLGAAQWKHKTMCTRLIKKGRILSVVVRRAKTGSVASNGYRWRSKKHKFFSQANNWDWYCSHVAYKREMREEFRYIKAS